MRHWPLPVPVLSCFFRFFWLFACGELLILLNLSPKQCSFFILAGYFMQAHAAVLVVFVSSCVLLVNDLIVCGPTHLRLWRVVVMFPRSDPRQRVMVRLYCVIIYAEIILVCILYDDNFTLP